MQTFASVFFIYGHQFLWTGSRDSPLTFLRENLLLVSGELALDPALDPALDEGAVAETPKLLDLLFSTDSMVL